MDLLNKAQWTSCFNLCPYSITTRNPPLFFIHTDCPFAFDELFADGVTHFSFFVNFDPHTRCKQKKSLSFAILVTVRIRDAVDIGTTVWSSNRSFKRM